MMKQSYCDRTCLELKQSIEKLNKSNNRFQTVGFW